MNKDGENVPVMSKTENVLQQYSDDKKLSIRSKLHAKHSTNKQGFGSWLFEKYRFSENTSILELGCGSGWQWEWDRKVEQLPQGCKLILSDFSEGMVNIARGRFYSYNADVDFQKIDVQEIPYGDESFDVVIANHVLYHVPDLNKALSEVRRVMKNGGRFYSVTNGNGGMSLFLHKALRNFDPKTEAFSQRYSFSLQNGGELLRKYFSSVERLDYEDSLAVTETQDLIDWIKSTISISGYSDNTLTELYEYFEAIRIKEGTINVPKEVGLFISIK